MTLMNNESHTERPGFWKNLVQNFNLLWFIGVLGLGGTSVAGFAFLNYTIKRPHGLKGLVNLPLVERLLKDMDGTYQMFGTYLKYHIGIFAALHVVALVLVMGLFVIWRIKYPEKYRDVADDPSRNTIIVAPALTISMTFNVFLVGGIFYSTAMKAHMQELMPYALGGWTLILLYSLYLVIQTQKTALTKGFEINNAHFGWLLAPFALSMTAVGGSGIAALAHDTTIARTAFVLTLVPYTMAGFLLTVKLISLFTSHYRSGMRQEIEFLPSFLIVVPILTVLAITTFRYGHFADHQLIKHLPQAFYSFVTTGTWAFQIWYLALGLMLLKDYFKKHYLNMKYFDESQWGLICPVVAFAVLGTFVYKTTLQSPVVLLTVATAIVLDIVLISATMVRQFVHVNRNLRQQGG
jgi:hypothetical protein